MNVADLDSQLGDALSKLDDAKAAADEDDQLDCVEAAMNLIDEARASLRLHKGTIDTATDALREQAEDLDNLAGELY